MSLASSSQPAFRPKKEPLSRTSSSRSHLCSSFSVTSTNLYSYSAAYLFSVSLAYFPDFWKRLNQKLKLSKSLQTRSLLQYRHRYQHRWTSAWFLRLLDCAGKTFIASSPLAFLLRPESRLTFSTKLAPLRKRDFAWWASEFVIGCSANLNNSWVKFQNFARQIWMKLIIFKIITCWSRRQWRAAMRWRGSRLRRKTRLPRTSWSVTPWMCRCSYLQDGRLMKKTLRRLLLKGLDHKKVIMSCACLSVSISTLQWCAPAALWCTPPTNRFAVLLKALLRRSKNFAYKTPSRATTTRQMKNLPRMAIVSLP